MDVDVINKVEEIKLLRKSFIEWQANYSQENKNKFNELKLQLKQETNKLNKKLNRIDLKSNL